jgi:hypothetical protein
MMKWRPRMLSNLLEAMQSASSGMMGKMRFQHRICNIKEGKSCTRDLIVCRHCRMQLHCPPISKGIEGYSFLLEEPPPLFVACLSMN